MQIENTIRRPKGSTVTLGRMTYRFGPAPDGQPHVTEVADTEHASHLLAIRPRVFVPYDASAQDPVPQAAAITPISGDLKSTAHPALLVVNPGEEPVTLEFAVAEAARYADLSPSDWNALSDSARFQFVEQWVTDKRRVHRSAQLGNPDLSVDTNAERLINSVKAGTEDMTSRSSASALAPEAVAAEKAERIKAQDKVAESLRDPNSDAVLESGTKPPPLKHMSQKQLVAHAKAKQVEGADKMSREELMATLTNFGVK
jgi:hypothetical protein